MEGGGLSARLAHPARMVRARWIRGVGWFMDFSESLPGIRISIRIGISIYAYAFIQIYAYTKIYMSTYININTFLIITRILCDFY